MSQYKEMKKQVMREAVTEIAKRYIVGDVINMKAFREENPKLVNKLTNLFGSVTEFKKFLGCRVSIAKPREIKFPKASVRNSLALDMLELLLQEHTFEEISAKYGVSRQAVHEIYVKLKSLRDLLDKGGEQ